MTTHFPTMVAARAAQQWWIVDATDIPLGRLSTEVARRLTGKSKPTWTPFTDTGDFVVVVNCEKAALTGRKEQGKTYISHTGYPGGFSEVTAASLRSKNPRKMVEEAIRGMLPKTRLGRAMAKKLKVYVGPEHPHVAQAPQAIPMSDIRRSRATTKSKAKAKPKKS
jgi:large subunit ribosomal protein L13